MTYAQDLLWAAYPWTLALHLIAVISWMAGLFYLPRLFVYHVEKGGKTKAIAKIYEEMESKLFSVIMTPAMIATGIFGLSLVFTPGLVDWSEWWPWIKAVLVIAMTGFHDALGRWRTALAAGENRHSGRYFRLINEVPTLLMFGIVILVIVRPF